ncbi:MAG: phytanoyl-CoA dioxygenase family protein [Flavobacteriales bacterium]
MNGTTTLRIHLDNTTETNGALRVIPKSHLEGVIRLTKEEQVKNEVSCTVERGGVMLMKPLILHASSRSTGKRNRRVIHLELCNKELPEELKWKERCEVEVKG